MGNTGNFCGTDSRPRQLLTMTNRPKLGPQYQKAQIQSQRFGQPLFTRKRDTLYNFMMSVRHDGALEQISVDMTILRELVDCVLYQNFDIQIQNKTIIDIFDMADHTQVLVMGRHRKTGQEYSVKVYPFESYSEHIFRKGLYEIFMHNLIGAYGRGVVNLLDYYVVDRGNQQKALVFLYEPVETSLANMIEYRNQTKSRWPELEQIYIIRGVLGGYETLNQKNIYHRDLRPSRIFYSKVKKQYLIGNLQQARVVMAVDLQRDALLTPRGVPFFNSQTVNQILTRGDRVGQYNALQNDYIFLKKLMLYLNNSNYQDTHDFISNQNLKMIYQQLHTMVPIANIMETIKHFDYKADDSGLAERVQLHLCDRNARVNKTVVLNTLFYLHQNQEFSRLAHLEIESNIETGKPLLNAQLFRRLGEYYASCGANSEDYFINALLLYIRSSVYNRKMGYLQRSVDSLHNAKLCDMYINDFSYKVIYLKQLAVVRATLGDVEESREVINMALKKAAEKGVPPIQELDLLLAKGEVSAYGHETVQGEKHLKFGLVLCEDREYFTEGDIQMEYKSKFLTLLAMNYYGAFMMPQPGEAPDKRAKHLAKAQSMAISALQLRQQLPSKGIDISNILFLLGKIYATRGDFYLGKKSFTRALQYRLSYKQQINPLLISQAFYEVATCHRFLDELQQSQRCYGSALRIFSALPQHKKMELLCRGYLGVVLVRQGRMAEGTAELQLAEGQLVGMIPQPPELMVLRQEGQRAMQVGMQVQQGDAMIKQSVVAPPGMNQSMGGSIIQPPPQQITTVTTSTVFQQPPQPPIPQIPTTTSQMGHSGFGSLLPQLPPMHVPPIHVPPIHVPPIMGSGSMGSDLRRSQQHSNYTPPPPQPPGYMPENMMESLVRPAGGQGSRLNYSQQNLSQQNIMQSQNQMSSLSRGGFQQQQQPPSQQYITEERVEEIYTSNRDFGGGAGNFGGSGAPAFPQPSYPPQQQNIIQSRVVQIQQQQQPSSHSHSHSRTQIPQQPPPPPTSDVMLSSFRNNGIQSIPYPPPPLKSGDFTNYQQSVPANFAEAFKGITPGSVGGIGGIGGNDSDLNRQQNFGGTLKPREIEIVDQRTPGPQGTSQHTITITEKGGQGELRGSRTIVINQGNGASQQQQPQSSHIFGPSALSGGGVIAPPAGPSNLQSISQLSETSIVRQPMPMTSQFRDPQQMQSPSQMRIAPPTTPMMPLNSNGAMATSSFVRGQPVQT